MVKISTLTIIKSVTEFVGISIVIISLYFVWEEMQQNRILAEANFDLMTSQNSLLINQSIVAHPDIWRKGCAGETLEKDDQVILERLVLNESDQVVYRVLKSLKIQDYASYNSYKSDFIGLLFHNPGARKVWTAHEDRLAAYRQTLGVYHTNQFAIDWVTGVKSALEELDKE